jgi:hypothetical protein
LKLHGGGVPAGITIHLGSRLCENSHVELARRNFVSITLNRNRTALAVIVERRKGRKQFCAFSAHARRSRRFLSRPRTAKPLRTLKAPRPTSWRCRRKKRTRPLFEQRDRRRRRAHTSQTDVSRRPPETRNELRPRIMGTPHFVRI